MEEFEEQTNEVSNVLADARDDLTEELRIKLIESGWRDQVASLCRQVIEQQGANGVKMLDIVRAVRPEAKSMVPAGIRAEMLARIRALQAEANVKNEI